MLNMTKDFGDDMKSETVKKIWYECYETMHNENADIRTISKVINF